MKEPQFSGGQDMNVLALVKGGERYIFFFVDNQRAETLHLFGRYARNPELSFSWYDAAVLSQKIRQESKKIMDTPSPLPPHPPSFTFPHEDKDSDDVD